MQKVFYSPGPYCTTDTYEIVEFDDDTTEDQLTEIGLDMAAQHYDSYQDEQEYEDEYGMERELDFCWYNIDDPEVQGHI